LRSSAGDGAAHLLLEREEEAGTREEHDAPDGGELVGAVVREHPLGDDEEEVGRDAVDDETGSDSERANGQWVVAAPGQGGGGRGAQGRLRVRTNPGTLFARDPETV
jgi:hypothetical protein